MHQIELRGVTYVYEGTDGQVAALRDVHFGVETAQFV